MDERLVPLDRRVAEAADAWLADSRDTGVYVRLVTAIEARRAYLHPLLELGHEPEEPSPVPEDLQPDEVLDDLDRAYTAHPERFVGKPPQPPRLPRAAWINKPPETEDPHDTTH